MPEPMLTARTAKDGRPSCTQFGEAARRPHSTARLWCGCECGGVQRSDRLNDSRTVWAPANGRRSAEGGSQRGPRRRENAFSPCARSREIRPVARGRTFRERNSRRPELPKQSRLDSTLPCLLGWERLSGCAPRRQWGQHSTLES
ncbi:hypothetical protein DIPPA_62957 [Diplonema papillatum]|nr:hypothetical protein DIPPA_62957 [Diplonema papillatum]